MEWESSRKKVNGQGKLFIANKMVDIPGVTHQYDYVSDYKKDGILIVLINLPENKPDENVYGINEKGDIVWELNKDNYLKLKHGFTHPYKDDQGNLWIMNLGGRHFKIDYKTSKVLDTKYEEIEYTIKGKVLHINNKKVKFQTEIEKIIPMEDILVVIIKYIDKENEHVFGVDKNGEIIWLFNKDNSLPNNSEFVNFSVAEGKWCIGDSKGYMYTIIPKTGKVLEREWLK